MAMAMRYTVLLQVPMVTMLPQLARYFGNIHVTFIRSFGNVSITMIVISVGGSQCYFPSQQLLYMYTYRMPVA